ncbi:MAG: hypothetical protein J5656_05390 [Clostridia bacterium]|nr:hypothetical protein [Clostridia bacterium]
MRKSIILSLIIMGLCIVVGVVGVTAAWFGDVMKKSDDIIITSYAPTGNASMTMDSASEYAEAIGKLVPAVATPEYVMTHQDGSGNLDSLDVLDSSLVGTQLTSIATRAGMEFNFIYSGTSDGVDGKKAIEIVLTSVTLQNPRTYITIPEWRTRNGYSADDNTHNPKAAIRYTRSGTAGNYEYTQNDTGDWVRYELALDDYKSEFDFDMSLSQYMQVNREDYNSNWTYYTKSGDGPFVYTQCNPQPTISSFPETDSPYYAQATWHDWTYTQTDDYTLYMLVVPFTQARFCFIVNFAKIDEETSPELINQEIFFNFEINSVRRT